VATELVSAVLLPPAGRIGDEVYAAYASET